MTQQKEAAELAAQVGTIAACWKGYVDNVVRPTVDCVGLPPNEFEYVKGSRLDFYAGAMSVFQILRAMYEQGKEPGGHILVTLEAEVAAFIAQQQNDESQHKPGHA